MVLRDIDHCPIPHDVLSASKYLFSEILKNPAAGAKGGAGPQVKLQVQPTGNVNLEISWNAATGAVVTSGSAPATTAVPTAVAKAGAATPAAAAPAKKQMREITPEEVFFLHSDLIHSIN
jgi:hypothetical protein